MSDEVINPSDLEFLVSRSMDEELAGDERRRLEEALSESPQLREEAGKLAKVDRLIKQWGEDHVEVDWQNYAALTTALATERDEDKELRKVDALLKRMGAQQPDAIRVDLSEAVMNRIMPAKRSAPWSRMIFRLGAPLAAAAAITIALTASLWKTPVTVVSIARGPTQTQQARIVVLFDRSPPAAGSEGISMMSVGVAPPPVWSDESPPL